MTAATQIAVATLSLLALAWVWKAVSVTRGLRRLPNLLDQHFDEGSSAEASLTVIVPACNEAAHIEGCVRSLLTQQLSNLHVVAVNDRSTDETPAILDRLAAESPSTLEVLHIAELPPNWLGKTHAMARAADYTTATHHPRWLLFTDGDILFAPEALRRALVAAEEYAADHFVLFPRTLIRRWDETAFLAFFSTLGLAAGQPWRVTDPRAREHVGVGAFNLIRADSYHAAGGFAALRMTIVEDIALGRLVKARGLRQQAATGIGLVSVHWASGLAGLTGVLTKNLFSVMNYRIGLVIPAALSLVLFFIVPFAALFNRATLLPAAITVLAMAWVYRAVGRRTGLSAWFWNVLAAPLAAAVFVFALLRSTVVTLRQGGVVWRGTFYPLGDLRREGVKLI